MIHLALDCAVLSLATIAVMNVWFHGSIFDSWRGYFEARSGRLGELPGCPLCFSPYIAWTLAWCFVIPAQFLWPPWDTILRLPVYIWAAILPVQLYFFGNPVK